MSAPPAGLSVTSLRSEGKSRQNWLLGSSSCPHFPTHQPAKQDHTTRSTAHITHLLLFSITVFAYLKVSFVRILLYLTVKKGVWPKACLCQCHHAFVFDNILAFRTKGECLLFRWFTNWVNKLQLRRVWQCLQTNIVLSTFWLHHGGYLKELLLTGIENQKCRCDGCSSGGFAGHPLIGRSPFFLSFGKMLDSKLCAFVRMNV